MKSRKLMGSIGAVFGDIAGTLRRERNSFDARARTYDADGSPTVLASDSEAATKLIGAARNVLKVTAADTSEKPS